MSTILAWARSQIGVPYQWPEPAHAPYNGLADGLIVAVRPAEDAEGES